MKFNNDKLLFISPRLMACNVACCFGIYRVTLYNSGIIISHINPMSSPSPVQPNPPSTPEEGQTAAVVPSSAAETTPNQAPNAAVQDGVITANPAAAPGNNQESDSESSDESDLGPEPEFRPAKTLKDIGSYIWPPSKYKLISTDSLYFRCEPYVFK
jgi:hypothetical protein